MSSVTPASSIASQPPIAPVEAVRAKVDAQNAERNAQKSSELTATAVAAQSAKEAGKGTVVDFKI